MSRLEDNNLPADGKADLRPIRQALSNWEPTTVQQLVFLRIPTGLNFSHGAVFFRSRCINGCSWQFGQWNMVVDLCRKRLEWHGWNLVLVFQCSYSRRCPLSGKMTWDRIAFWWLKTTEILRDTPSQEQIWQPQCKKCGVNAKDDSTWK